MKKVRVLTLIVLLFLLVGSAAYATQIGIRVFVNGVELQGDIPSQYVNGVLMLPAVEVAKAINANMTIDLQTSTVSITQNAFMFMPTRSAVKYWYTPDSDIVIPPIDGTDTFKEDITEAFNLLKEKDYFSYIAAAAYIQSVHMAEDVEDTARIYYDTYKVTIDPDLYNDYKKRLKHADFVILLASILSHEAAHAQIHSSGLYDRLAPEDSELFAIITEYRTAKTLGIGSDFIRSRRQWVKDYANKLK